MSARIISRRRFQWNEVEYDYDARRYSPHYSTNERGLIDLAWANRQKHAAISGATLFDAPIYRLHELDDLEERMRIRLGDTTYKAYVGTRHPSCSIERADPIGTTLIPVTSDGFVPIWQRSPRVDVNPGFYFTCGGFFDRDSDTDPASGSPDLFICAQREAFEELGVQVPREHITGLGLVYDDVNCHPNFVFGFQFQQTRAQATALSCGEELTNLQFQPVTQLGDFALANRDRITGSFACSLMLFEAWALGKIS